MGAPEEEAPRPPSDITVYGANCSLHGLSHVFLPGGVTFRRLLWAAAFSASLSIFLIQVADRVIEYYQYPHVTILDEMDSPVMFFPAISICNYNSYRKSQISRNDVFWMAGLLGVEQGDFDDFVAALGQPTDDSKFFPSKTFNMLEFVQRTSHNMDEMLLDCKYRGKDCGSENFTLVSMAPSAVFGLGVESMGTAADSLIGERILPEADAGGAGRQKLSPGSNEIALWLKFADEARFTDQENRLSPPPGFYGK
ncbi:Acid-sensing ion channel 3 [Liparis tanakae]|uniref:Acid-sensing ion channel 3 n=1 Tax=Liparis tanakae TaxID=230148 RepID=A0A4Z2GQ87_9TELE|nr:Acid-sensing ion channel 3 [Liparis tanakae]